VPRALKVEMVGLKAFQRVGSFVKPTTRLVQVFGRKASKSTWNLEEVELRALVRDGIVDFPERGFEDGYLILRFGEYVLGLGLLIRGRLKSQIPRKDLPFYSADRD